MLYSIKTLLSKGVYLPLVYDIIAFVVLAINAVLLCRYWHLEKRVIYYVICGLVLTAQPFTLSMLYFVHMTPEVYVGVTCVLAALLLSEIIAVPEVSIAKAILYSVIAIILINFSLAMYPVIINAIAVVFIGRLLVQSFVWDGSWQNLKIYLKPITISITNIVLGIALYKFMVTIVFPTKSFYNTDTLSWNQLPERLRILLTQSFHQLYEYKYPFISQWVLWVFLGFGIILALYIAFTGKFQQKVVRFFFLLCSLFATQTAMMIANTHFVAGRVELLGLVFFEVLVMTLVLTQLKKLHNLSVLAGVCVIFTSIINDLDCLRVWKLGFDAERMLWNRVIARMEIQKDFAPPQKYDVVQVGRGLSIRYRYYADAGEKFIGETGSVLFASYDPSFAPFRAQEFYYPTKFRRSGFTAYFEGKSGYNARLRRLYQAGVLQKAEVWPKSNGLIVWKDIILFVTDGKELEKCKKQFEQEFGKK